MAPRPATALTLSRAELLSTHPGLEPLRADGRACHGGFDADGAYVSPRTLHRTPAIAAWAEHNSATFDTLPLDVPLDRWPENFPNVEQSKVLLRHGVREPIIASLTRIGTVEGFGAFLRYTSVPEMALWFDDDIADTATSHLGGGLIEAHARDEAGHGGVAGHNEMWFAARDIAFEHPATEDQTTIMLERMGITGPGGTVSRSLIPPRRLLVAFDHDLELLIDRMVRLMMIEIQAFHTFAWAEALLSDQELVAGDGEAARLVSYIRADETPHVEYLRTSLTEMRDRTFRLSDGTTMAGRDVISAIWDPALNDSLTTRRTEFVSMMGHELEHAVAGRPDADDLLDELGTLGPVGRTSPGIWTERSA